MAWYQQPGGRVARGVVHHHLAKIDGPFRVAVSDIGDVGIVGSVMAVPWAVPYRLFER